MAKHTLELNLPKSELVNVDAELVVKADGKRLGTAHLSKGGIDWVPANRSKYGYSLTWERFAALMTENGRSRAVK